MLCTRQAFDDHQQEEMSLALVLARLLRTRFLSPAGVRSALSSKLAHTLLQVPLGL